MKKVREEADFKNNLTRRQTNAIIQILQKDLAAEKEAYSRVSNEANHFKSIHNQRR